MRFIAVVVASITLAATAWAGVWYGVADEDAPEPIAVSEVMADPDAYLDRAIAVSGLITEVCTRRGCWAVLQHEGEMLRVKARDHSFALPPETRGAAVAHGVFERVEAAPDQARRRDEEGADPAALDRDVEYRLDAIGVFVREATANDP